MAALLPLLWSDPQLWQHRLVYRIELSTITHARVSAHYHLVIPPALLDLAGVEAGASAVRALIPLTWRPKELLLNLALTSSADSPVHLLTRVDVAWLQADMFIRALSETDLMTDVDVDDLLSMVEAVAKFMPRRVRAAADLTEDSTADEVGTRLQDATFLARFLTDATGLAIGAHEIEGWKRTLRLPQDILARTLDAAPSPESSSENFLLAMSELEPRNLAELDYFASAFRSVVLGLSARSELSVLRHLARLGREWRVIIDTEVPTYRPVTITMSDDRPLGAVNVRHQVLKVPVPLADGSSLHVETQLLDPSARLKDVKVVGIRRAEVQLPLSDDVRETDDRHAVYLSSTERPDHGIARISVGLTSDVRWTNGVVLVLAWTALALSCLVSNSADIFALLVIPATLAVSVVQVRERTSIVRGLTAGSRRVLFGVAIALWLVAALRLLIQSEGADGLYDLVGDLLREES
ncbi:hypothetical protein [Blastococcus sp. SYSU DS0619]